MEKTPSSENHTVPSFVSLLLVFKCLLKVTTANSVKAAGLDEPVGLADECL